QIIDVHTIIAVSPPGSGTVGVIVGSGPNLSPGTSATLFTYLKPVITDIGPHQGLAGTAITIRGARLATTRSISLCDIFGNVNVNADLFTVIDDHTVIAQTPHCLGSVICSFKVATNVVVTTDAYGTNEVLHQCCSELFFADFFLFFATQPRPVPTVTS